MKLEEVALQLFIKRSAGGYVNTQTMAGFMSEMQASLELAELFMKVCAQHKKPKPINVPEDEL